MKNLKALALTALTTAATVIGTAGQAAVTHNGTRFYTPDDFTGHHATIVEKLYQMDVPVIDGRGTEACESRKGGVLMGWYTSQNDYMVLCYGNQNDINETLTHEAVHVVQDCRDGLNNGGLVGPNNKFYRELASNISEHKAETITNLYPTNKWVIETEAFYFEDKPALVSNALTNVCGVR